MQYFLNSTKKIMNSKTIFLFIDESGKPEVYSAKGVNLAVFQVFERGVWKWHEIIKNRIGRIHDICNKKYFTRSNPLELST